MKLIKINKNAKPEKLTTELQNELTKAFIESRERVWNKTFIKESLLDMTFNKCVYCECQLNIEGNYMEVEHFYPKEIYPHLVVDWDNLLPSCKRCNVNKKDHDPQSEKIIDPSKTDPKHHLYFKGYRYRKKDFIGQNTIDVLYLNDLDKAVTPRFQVGESTEETIDSLADKIFNITEERLDVKTTNKVVNGCKNLFREALSNKQYSATVATIISTNPKIIEIIDKLKEFHLWDDELEELKNSINQNCLNSDHSLI